MDNAKTFSEPAMPHDVAQKFDAYPAHVRPKLDYLRHLIFSVANETEDVGAIEETLKWGEPAYLTSQSKSGTTIRIDWKQRNPDRYCIYVSCNTSLIKTWKEMFPKFEFEGKRAVVLQLDQPAPEDELRLCIRSALRYHLDS